MSSDTRLFNRKENMDHIYIVVCIRVFFVFGLEVCGHCIKETKRTDRLHFLHVTDDKRTTYLLKCLFVGGIVGNLKFGQGSSTFSKNSIG